MHVIIIVLVYMLLLYMSTCRPQDTHKEDNATDQADLNLVYWSNEGVLLWSTLLILTDVFIETTVEANIVCGKCAVQHGEDIEGDIDFYFLGGPDRFYFLEVRV